MVECVGDGNVRVLLGLYGSLHHGVVRLECIDIVLVGRKDFLLTRWHRQYSDTVVMILLQ